jgi:hypothetical protein
MLKKPGLARIAPSGRTDMQKGPARGRAFVPSESAEAVRT